MRARSAPLVTAITIFLDEERFLAEAIDSVLAQDGVSFELLLVDDGSSDGSTALALDYARRHPEFVRYLEHEGHANKRQSATRNLGLAHARGEYVAFIDADDRWRPGKLAEQVALLDRMPDVGMVCGVVNYWSSWDGGVDRLVPTGSRRDVVLRPSHTSLALYPLGSGDSPCPSDLMVRRALVEDIGGFEDGFTDDTTVLYEDQGFFAKIFLRTPVYFSSRTWLDYRQHADSCVAGIAPSDRYRESRRHFLDWFAGYLERREPAGKAEVLRAIRAARRDLVLPRPLARLRRRWSQWLGDLVR